MIHVCESLGPLARCTAARCRYSAAAAAAAAAAAVIMTGLTQSLSPTRDSYVCFLQERERWTLRDRWIDRHGEKESESEGSC